MPLTVKYEFDARVPMRDGVELSADIYFPPEPGEYPAILQRTPYDNIQPYWVQVGEYFARHGYVFVSQDVRGRGDSDGKFVPFQNEANDGYDTIEWVAQQPWCNGKVGMMGGSYNGFVQWAAAKELPPHLVTVASSASAARPMQDYPYKNGKMMLFIMSWLNRIGGRTSQDSGAADSWPKSPVDWKKVLLYRPLKAAMDDVVGRKNTVWREWLAHPNFDEYWRSLLVVDGFDKIDLPSLHITGWYDNAILGEFYFHDRMQAESPAVGKQFLLVGPWDHMGTRAPAQVLGGIDFTPASVVDILDVHLRWFDRWLKGETNGDWDGDRVRIFVMGRNQWRTEKAWPLPDAQTVTYYLHSGGRANSSAGDGLLNRDAPGTEPTDAYAYDPLAPTLGAPDFDAFVDSTGREAYKNSFLPLVQTEVEQRRDVLVYNGEPLAEEIEVTGTPVAVLYAASDALDTDFAAVLGDVYPDGRSVRVAEGILRACYRESLARPSLLTPGQVYEYRIELNPVSIAFLPGHRIRLSVMSCRFPMWDRNANTGTPIGEDGEVRVAHQELHHTAAHPSRVELPVIPARRPK